MTELLKTTRKRALLSLVPPPRLSLSEFMGQHLARKMHSLG